MITLVVMIAALLPSIDNTIANVALPRMQGNLSATQDQMSWVLTSYIVGMAIMTPLGGWLADRFGRKAVFFYSILAFTAASALCGVAVSLEQVVLFRTIQGIAGASLMPLSQAVMFDTFPPGEQGRAMAIWSLGIVVGPMLGPVLGGWLTDNLSWRWIFYINVPFGIAGVLGVRKYLPDSAAGRRSFDFFGFAALAVFVGSLQLMLDRGSAKDWFGSGEIRAYALVGALALYVFIAHTLTTERPFVRFSLYRDRNLLSGTIVTFLVAVVMFSNMSLLPAMLQNLMNYSVLQAGLMMMPRSIGTAIAMFIVSRAIGRIDSRIIIGCGLSLAAFALWQMSHFAPVMGMATIFWTSVLQGVGTGCVYVPLATMTFATLAAAYRNEGSATTALLRNVGASVGIAMAQAILVHNTQVVHARLAAHVTPYMPIGHRILSTGGARAAALLNAEVTAQSSMVAYIDNYHLMTLLTLLALPVLLLIRRPTAVGPELKEVVVD